MQSESGNCLDLSVPPPRSASGRSLRVASGALSHYTVGRTKEMSDEQRTKTVEYYNHHAEEWVATHGGLREKTWWVDEVAHFHDLLPSGRVLEVGPGSGSDAAAL